MAIDQAVHGQACREGGCAGVCAWTSEHVRAGDWEDSEDVAALCQANATYPHNSACPLRQPGCTQSSIGMSKSPRC